MLLLLLLLLFVVVVVVVLLLLLYFCTVLFSCQTKSNKSRVRLIELTEKFQFDYV